MNSAIAAHCWKTLRLIATDMDGTLTQRGKFSRELLQGLEHLSAANIPVLIVTGRSAGWVSGLVNYLPVQGAIAENGGLYYPANREQPVFLSTIADITSHRQQLAQTYQRLKSEFQELHESADRKFGSQASPCHRDFLPKRQDGLSKSMYNPVRR